MELLLALASVAKTGRSVERRGRAWERPREGLGDCCSASESKFIGKLGLNSTHGVLHCASLEHRRQREHPAAPPTPAVCRAHRSPVKLPAPAPLTSGNKRLACTKSEHHGQTVSFLYSAPQLVQWAELPRCLEIHSASTEPGSPGLGVSWL